MILDSFAVTRLSTLLSVHELQTVFRTSHRVTLQRIRRELVPLGGVYKIGTRLFVSARALKEHLAKAEVRRTRLVKLTVQTGAQDGQYEGQQPGGGA